MERPTCPKCGYTRLANDTAPVTECPSCGIVFAKYAQFLADKANGKQHKRMPEDRENDSEPDVVARFFSAFTAAPKRADSATLGGEALVLLILAIWGGWFIQTGWQSGEAGQSFLHNVNLAFHEFGHLLFRPLGQWMMFLGGSLFQCLVPLMLAGVFLLREHQPFSAAACIWWTGQNLIDVAPYIGDATSMDLPLVGEWNEEAVEMRYLRHDWHNLLEPLGMLSWDHRLAALAHWSGALIMLAGLAWAGWWVWRHVVLLRSD